MKSKTILKILPHEVKEALLQLGGRCEQLQEIRMRIGQPLILMEQGKELISTTIVTERLMKEALDYISNYSLYAYENELKQGFITIEGGHRVGVAGCTALENGHVKNLKYITFLNIRISHEVLRCADKLFPYITKGNELYHTLIISPPRCGKTTLLRDLIRQISDGNSFITGRAVGVVDERSELSGCYKGVPQHHMGMRTDILDNCPKAEGMLMLIRSMSPQVIAVDEIGAMDEVRAIQYSMNCGCKMLATVHGKSMEEIQKKPLFHELLERQCFERFIVLQNRKKVGEVVGVYDRYGNLI